MELTISTLDVAEVAFIGGGSISWLFKDKVVEEKVIPDHFTLGDRFFLAEISLDIELEKGND